MAQAVHDMPIGLCDTFSLVAVLHFVPAWVYLFLCPRHLPREGKGKLMNPFDSASVKTRSRRSKGAANVKIAHANCTRSLMFGQ